MHKHLLLLMIVLSLLESTRAVAAVDFKNVLPTSSTQLFRGQPQANEWASSRDVHRIWTEGRDTAFRDLNKVMGDADLRDAVGEDMDQKGAKCFALTRLAEVLEQAGTKIVAHCMSRKISTPPWLSHLVANSKKQAKEACDDKDDGQGGFRQQNLGKRYLWEWRNKPEARAQLDSDAQTMVLVVEGLAWLKETAKTAGQLGGQAAGAVGGPALLMVNPCAVDPKLPACRQGEAESL
jgi:hypothetical protein